MPASSKSALLIAAGIIRNEHGDKANTAVRVGDEIIALIKSLRFNVFDVTSYGINATGSTGAQAAAAFALAAVDAATSLGTVYVPAGTYGDTSGWSFAIPSGVTLELDSQATLICVHVTATGTTGAEIPFTAPAVRGATSISIPATGLTDAYLRLSSVINCQSTDAGADQLGTHSADASFFGEFVQVSVGGGASATLYGPLVFPYSNTAGGSSGSFTTSVARQITFHAGSRIRGGKFLGKHPSFSEIILATFCRDFVIDENTVIDANDQSTNLVRLKYCLDSEWRVPRGFGKRTGVTGAQENGFVMSSSQNCFAVRGSIEHCYQCYDVTYETNDATYRGGPSINCGARGATARNPALDGFTSHYGCYASVFDGVHGVGIPNFGVRIRSRGDRVSGGSFLGMGAAAVGVYIDEGAAIESIVDAPLVVGGARAVQYDHSTTGLATLEALLGCGACIISKPICRGQSGVAIYCATAYTSASLVGPRILYPEIHQPGSDAIRIDPYNNGTVVMGPRVNGVLATRAAVAWGANNARLHVDDVHAFGVNAAGFALKGPSTGSFMTDAATFPAGEAAALLFLGKVYTDAATPFSGIYRDTGGVAYVRAQVAGWQPNVEGLAPASPTLSTAALMAWYLSGTEMLGKSVDAAGAVTRTYAPPLRGAGTPEAAVTAPVGTLFVRTDGGAATTLYVKESGAGNVGWVAK